MDKFCHDITFKFLIVGDSGVGKSSLLLRFDEDKFSNNFLSTIGIDFRSKVVNIDGTQVKLQLWDTSGQERFKTITHAYYRGAVGVILVYDITDPLTFNNVGMWINSLKEHATPNILKILVGNKCDLEDSRIITRNRGQKLAEEYDIKFFEASAKNGNKVNEIFKYLAETALKNKLVPDDPPNTKLRLDEEITRKCGCNI